MAVLLHTFQKRLLPMRVSVVVSLDTYEKTLTTSVVTVFACFIHFTSFLDKKLPRNINMYEIAVSFFSRNLHSYITLTMEAPTPETHGCLCKETL